jgi:phosphonate transport system substrate-binding protein
MTNRKMARLFRMPLLSLLILLMPASAGAQAPQGDELLMGVAPFMSPASLFKRMTPLRIHLGKALKREVVIELNKDVRQLLKRTAEDRFDLLYTGPNFAIRAFDSGLYVPGVIPGNLTRSHLLVSPDSPINALSQLSGKTVSTPPGRGAAAKMAHHFFLNQGMTVEQLPVLKAYASHNAAFMAMKQGDVDAAFIAEFGYRDALAAGEKARVLATTAPYPGISLIISKRLDPELRESIIKAMLALKHSEEGRSILKQIAFPPFRRFKTDEFNRVRDYFSAPPVNKGK